MSRLPVKNKTLVTDEDSEVVAMINAALDLTEFKTACRSDDVIQQVIQVIRSTWRIQTNALDSFYMFCKLKDKLSLHDKMVVRDEHILLAEFMQS